MPITIIATDETIGLPPEAGSATVTPSAPVQPVTTRQEEEPSDFDGLQPLIAKYKNPQTPTDKDDAIQEILASPYQGGTVGSWVKGKLRKSQNPEQQAMLLVMYVLDRYKPGEKFMAKLNEEVIGSLGKSHKTGLEEDPRKGPQSNTMELAINRFLPYLNGTESIDEDIVNKFPDLSEQIWQQYKRDAWNNYDDRIDKAKAWAAAETKRLAAENPQGIQQLAELIGNGYDIAGKPARKPNPGLAKAIRSVSAGFELKRHEQYQVAYNILKWNGIDLNDKSKPYWLTQEMVDPAKRGIGPGYIALALEQNAGGMICTEGEGEEGQKVCREISNQDVERARWYAGGNVQQTPEYQVREIRKSLPESTTHVIPEQEQGKLQDRQHFMNVSDPNYKKVMSYIERRLYPPPDLASPSEFACAIVLRLLADVQQPGQTKEESKASMAVNREKMNAVLRKYHDAFDRPLRLKDEPQAMDEDMTANMRFTLVYAQVLKDVSRFLTDDTLYNRMIKEMGMEANAAVLRKALIFAINGSHFGLFKFANLPSKPTEIEAIVDNLFGDTPNGLIARVMCQHRDPFGGDTLLAIEKAMKQRYPQEWKVLRYSISQLLSKIQTAISNFQSEEKHRAEA